MCFPLLYCLIWLGLKLLEVKLYKFSIDGGGTLSKDQGLKSGLFMCKSSELYLEEVPALDGLSPGVS